VSECVQCPQQPPLSTGQSPCYPSRLLEPLSSESVSYTTASLCNDTVTSWELLQDAALAVKQRLCFWYDGPRHTVGKISGNSYTCIQEHGLQIEG
jgi:hypothetical protein